MKYNFCKTGLLAVACAASIWSAPVASAADVVVSSTNMGTIEQFSPGSDVIVRSETATDPIRYSTSTRTTYVDEDGAPVAVERISRGTPVTVHTVREGDRVFADRVVVRRAPSVVTERRTTTTTTRPLTDDERDAAEERIEARKERLEDLEDELDD
jgi:hypothetical protein